MTETYPRVYRYKGWVLTAWLSLEIAMIVAGCAAIFFAEALFKTGAVVGWGGGGFFIALAMPALVSTVRGKFFLYADRGEYTGILGTRILPTVEVRATRKVQRRYGHLMVTIVLNSGRKVTISDFGHLDDALAAWINQFPNAEVDARVTRNERLLANPAFGKTSDEREANINADAKRLSLLHWPGYGLVLWGMIWPQPYTVCLSILLVMPLIGLVATLASRGRWTLRESDNDGKLSIGLRLFIAPAWILALRAFLDHHVVDWMVPIAWGIGAGIVLTGLNGLIERRLHRMDWAVMAFSWGLYAWGGLVYIDTTFDPSPGRPIPVRILDMTEGEHDHTLHLSAWGFRPADNEVTVGGGFYRQLHIGDTVCIYVYRGLLTWPWYEAGHCPDGKPAK